jgi:hypothetical protein
VAHIARSKGNPAESLAASKRAADYYESIGHRRAAFEAFGNVGLGLLEVGRLEAVESRS